MQIDQIARFADVPLDVDVVLGRRLMTLQEVLGLEVGAVIRLSKCAGENIDVSLGDAVVGFGEIVVIEDAMGFRITDFQIEE